MYFRPFIKPVIWTSAILGLGCWILYPVFMHAQTNAQRSNCQSNLKQIALSCAQYSQDYEGRLPTISRGEQGWADALNTYAKTYTIFHCPIVGKSAARSSDFFLSARVANFKTSQLKFPNQTISFGEGLANGAVNSHFSELPLDWETDAHSPAQRHFKGANYAFVDGRVKWIRPERISTLPPSHGDDWRFTFAVR